MVANGTNGQFGTPRHIIRMMVELMEPPLKDTICDPAMGNVGFIVENTKYITENYKDKLVKEEKQKHYKTTMFNGFIKTTFLQVIQTKINKFASP